METKIPNKNTAEPLFNAGLAFLERLHKLAMIYHEAMSNKQFDVAYTCLSGLTSEMAPRINEEEFTKLKQLRTKSWNIIQMRNQPNTKISGNTPSAQMTLEDWFIDINMALHRHGLIMPNKDDMSNATKI